MALLLILILLLFLLLFVLALLLILILLLLLLLLLLHLLLHLAELLHQVPGQFGVGSGIFITFGRTNRLPVVIQCAGELFAGSAQLIDGPLGIGGITGLQ